MRGERITAHLDDAGETHLQIGSGKPTGFAGLDELATRLGVMPHPEKGAGAEVFVVGRSNQRYGLVELIERLLDRFDDVLGAKERTQ